MASFGQRPPSVVWSPQAATAAGFGQSPATNGWTHSSGLGSFGQSVASTNWPQLNTLTELGQCTVPAGWTSLLSPASLIQRPATSGQPILSPSCQHYVGNPISGGLLSPNRWSQPVVGLEQHPAFAWAQGCQSHNYPWTQTSGPLHQEIRRPIRDPVTSFMQKLRLSPSEVADFRWVAEYGLSDSVLPDRWTSHLDTSSGNVYYVDKESNYTTWDHPLESYLLQIIEIGRLYFDQPSADFFKQQQVLLWEQHAEELEEWHGPLMDQHGRSYFTNSVTGVSSWNDPRRDTQHIFDLERALLDGLVERLPSPRAVAAQRTETLPSFGRQDEVACVAHPNAKVVDAAESAKRANPQLCEQFPKQRTPRSLVWELATASDCRSAVQRMSALSDLLYATCQDETEAQELNLAHRATLRRRRMRGEVSPSPSKPLSRHSGLVRLREAQETDFPP